MSFTRTAATPLDFVCAGLFAHWTRSECSWSAAVGELDRSPLE